MIRKIKKLLFSKLVSDFLFYFEIVNWSTPNDEACHYYLKFYYPDGFNDLIRKDQKFLDFNSEKILLSKVSFLIHFLFSIENPLLIGHWWYTWEESRKKSQQQHFLVVFNQKKFEGCQGYPIFCF